MFYEQALITKKTCVNGFSVERNYVNSKDYHDKFLKLPLKKRVTESLYREAGRLLNAVDGQETERMLAVNAETGELIVDNLNRKGYIDRTSFTENEYRKLKSVQDEVVLIHNHSYNRPPSGRNIASYSMDRQVKISLILCHDGDVYAIFSAKKEVAEIYEMAYNEFRKQYDMRISKILATKLLYDSNGDGRLFDVRRL